MVLGFGGDRCYYRDMIGVRFVHDGSAARERPGGNVLLGVRRCTW